MRIRSALKKDLLFFSCLLLTKMCPGQTVDTKNIFDGQYEIKQNKCASADQLQRP